jgi:hypothetical protein
MIAMRVCRRHPKERAGWNCASCRADLCPDCVTKQPGGLHGTQIPVCCTCGRGVAPISPSVLDLPTTPSLESQGPVPDGEAKSHSRLRFGIVVSPSLLKAQAFVEHDDPGPVDLPQAEAKAAAEPSPPAAEPEPATHPASPAEPAPATHPASPAGPVTAFVEPRPGPLNISAAPTVYGFSPALSPPTEAPPTRIGHAALQPPAPEDKKDR